MARKRKTDEEMYHEKLQRDNLRMGRISATARDIAPLPAVARPRRKSRCKKSLRLFCETYMGAKFPLAWSADHLKVLARMEECVLRGGRFALAMPRGSGKTSLCEAAAGWALLYAHRRFVALIGATEPAAEEMLESIRVEFESNELLLEDFPEVCYPIARLEGIANRCKGQTLDGERTRIEWTQKELVLPTVKRSAASGSRVRVAGITGRVRGMKGTTADGRSIRPDLVIVDDPQDDESARSPSQNAYRERILSGAVLGLAGPASKISAVMPCTVIAPGDLADRTLDRVRNPEWQGERCKMVYSFPANEALWDEYGRVRAEGFRAGDGGRAGNEFYQAHREEMDKGASVAWPERKNPDDVSAVQHAMNLRLADPIAFASEYQNEPLDQRASAELEQLTADDVAAKLSRIPRGVVPRDCTRLTAGVDVQGRVLYWLVAAWDESFGGTILDYGAFPRQNRAYFTAADARPSFDDAFPGVAQTGQIYAALSALAGDLLGLPYKRDGDAGEGKESARVEKCLVDANWGVSTDTVYQWSRKTPWGSVVLPAHGHGIGASGRPMREWPQRAGEAKGPDWVRGPSPQGRGLRVTFDSNSWKSQVAEKLRTPPGSSGCLWLPGERASEHQLLADHLASEARTVTEGRGRKVEEWRIRPDRPENHWWDCLVLAAVGASLLGLRWSAAGAAGQREAPEPKRAKVKLSDIQKMRR